MKRIFLTLLSALLLLVPAVSKNRTVTERDSLGTVKRVIELRDTVIDGKAQTDTLSILTYEDTDDATDCNTTGRYTSHSTHVDVLTSDEFGDLIKGMGAATGFVTMLALLLVFGLPLLIVLLVLLFGYKNRRAKYRLVEKALESGQPLPADFFKQAGIRDLRERGFKNLFLGLGLFIFLWALTDEFGLGCIGLLIMCTGLGQLATYYTRNRKDDARK